MSDEISRPNTGFRICMSKIQVMEQRLESLEHLANQQSILVDTLGNIMEELKKQEL